MLQNAVDIGIGCSIQHGLRDKRYGSLTSAAYGLPHGKSSEALRWTIVGPDSSYSLLEIHICWKVLKEERIEPPIHTEYFRSGGATTLIFIVDGANAVSSFVILSPIPANMVVPPERTTLP